MRIAQVSPLHEAVPPRTYGGTERVVSFLTEELVAMGHDVTLFASGDSITEAELVAPWPRALRSDPSVLDRNAPHSLMMEMVARRASEFDILHCHLDYHPFSVLSRGHTPFVTTLHGRLDLPELPPVFAMFPDAPVVSISDQQRVPLPQASFIQTVHHGLPIDLLTPQPVVPSYLAFLGRIAPEKCPDAAIRIARGSNRPLRLAAKIDRADDVYFGQVVAPMLADGGAELIGEISDIEKPDFLSGALALLLPLSWEEPFGLVMIEAMACGCPVIAYNRGSVPEVIEDGVTGFIVENEVQAVAAVGRLHMLDRRAIRAQFEARFTARRMAEDYLGIYRRLARERRANLRAIG